MTPPIPTLRIWIPAAITALAAGTDWVWSGVAALGVASVTTLG